MPDAGDGEALGGRQGRRHVHLPERPALSSEVDRPRRQGRPVARHVGALLPVLRRVQDSEARQGGELHRRADHHPPQQLLRRPRRHRGHPVNPGAHHAMPRPDRPPPHHEERGRDCDRGRARLLAQTPHRSAQGGGPAASPHARAGSGNAPSVPPGGRRSAAETPTPAGASASRKTTAWARSAPRRSNAKWPSPFKGRAARP